MTGDWPRDPHTQSSRCSVAGPAGTIVLVITRCRPHSHGADTAAAAPVGHSLRPTGDERPRPAGDVAACS